MAATGIPGGGLGRRRAGPDAVGRSHLINLKILEILTSPSSVFNPLDNFKNSK
jgi:hypothetical protein